MKHICKGQPAKIYDLNILSSILSRCFVRTLSTETSNQIRKCHESILDVLNDNSKPILVHSNPEACRQILNLTQKLALVHNAEVVVATIPSKQLKESFNVVKKVREHCEHSIKTSLQGEFYSNRSDIAQLFGFPGMWDNADIIIQQELEKWHQLIMYPPTPQPLSFLVERYEAQILLNFFADEILDCQINPSIDIYMLSDPSLYHLFWAVTTDTIDYCIPSTYSFAQLLSFDLPHIIAHLVHLQALQTDGVWGYIDECYQRSYFEAVAVLSEHQFVTAINSNNDIVERMSALLSSRRKIRPELLRSWVLQNRCYEFKLRCARYYGDVLTVNGLSFHEAANIVSNDLKIDFLDAKNEIEKYYAWTGLNAVYTLGYNRLLSTGISRVSDAIKSPHGSPIKDWKDLEQISELKNKLP